MKPQRTATADKRPWTKNGGGLQRINTDGKTRKERKHPQKQGENSQTREEGGLLYKSREKRRGTISLATDARDTWCPFRTVVNHPVMGWTGHCPVIEHTGEPLTYGWVGLPDLTEIKRRLWQRVHDPVKNYRTRTLSNSRPTSGWLEK